MCLASEMDKFEAVEQAINAGEKIKISRDQNGRVSVQAKSGTYLFANASEIMELPRRFPDMPFPPLPH